MVRKWILAGLFLMAASLFAGCGKQETAAVKPAKLVKVQLIVPKTADAGTNIPLKAVVTQGKEKVDDADEVKFEIWKKNSDKNSSMLEAKHDQHGIYTAKTVIKEPGTYTVQVHVTARKMHVMPKTDLSVNYKKLGSVKAFFHALRCPFCYSWLFTCRQFRHVLP